MRKINRCIIGGLLLSIICMASCSKKTPLQDEPEETKGLLYVHPQWVDFEWNHTLYTHLYTTKSALLDLETASTGYAITAESGVYSLISHNTNISGVQFTDLDNFYQAKATAIRIDQTRTDDKALYPSGNAYRLAVEEVTVKAGEENHIYPHVYPLTRTFVIRFVVTNGDTFNRIKGALEGVYFAVYLATGLPVGEETDWHIPFETAINDDNTATATIHLLGLYDPANGLNYENILPVVLEDDDGDTYPTEIDLSEVLTDILDDNGGQIPIDIPVEIEVALEQINGSLVAVVKPWDEGKGGGEV
ncbi:hypothetical protein M2133_001256 [Parabacteroides sp. PF5-6]|nr:hypothetical protein [Parabacteroides sp. PF5-6]